MRLTMLLRLSAKIWVARARLEYGQSGAGLVGPAPVHPSKGVLSVQGHMGQLDMRLATCCQLTMFLPMLPICFYAMLLPV